MDSSLPALGIRPWRTATLIAAAVAALELVLLVVAGFALLARPLAHHVQAAAARRVEAAKPAPAAVRRHHRAVPVKPLLARAKVPVLVLNGNGRSGAAGAEAAQVQHAGYPVAHVGDAARMDYPTSVVMYGPGFRREGLRLARDLGVPVVGPLDGFRLRDLAGARAVLVVGH